MTIISPEGHQDDSPPDCGLSPVPFNHRLHCLLWAETLRSVEGRTEPVQGVLKGRTEPVQGVLKEVLKGVLKEVVREEKTLVTRSQVC